jgi:potassium/chloride transporter 9
VFVEYESDVEEERGRVRSLLENLRIQAEVLVFALAAGDLKTYEVIINGSDQNEEEVEKCLQGQEWWDELQKFRGKRGGTTASEDLADIASIFTAGSAWPEASFQQGPRGERVERFLGLRKLLRKSRKKRTLSGISKLGVSLGMRTQKLSPSIMQQHVTQESASEASDSDSDSDSEAVSSDYSEGPHSAASEADMSDYESESDSPPRTNIKQRRKSLSDTIRGPPPSKKSTGEREVKVPESSIRNWFAQPQSKVTEHDKSGTVSVPDLASDGPASPASPAKKSASTADIISHTRTPSDTTTTIDGSRPTSSQVQLPTKADFLKPSSSRSERPPISRHTSQPKFSSRPVPITRVATEDGPGPSIMFADTPSTPPRRGRLPSAYQASDANADKHTTDIPTLDGQSDDRRGSSYSTQAIPLSFNDLPCRAQHLILNELMRKYSEETAVMFTTLPSPALGTSDSQEASAAYLADLEVLCKGCPPVLMVHSNSMTVTMSL